MYQTLVKKLDKKKAVIGIIGLGYVGLPLSIRFSKVGYKVIGFDIDRNKIKYLNQNKSYISHISNKDIKSIQNNFLSTSSFNKINKVDIVILCVPTPLKKNKTPDLSFIINTIKMISPYLVKGQAVSLESTTYPGTTEEVVLPFIKKLNFNIGKNFFLVYSPEREDPGNKNFSTKNIPKVVGGVTENCLKTGIAIYQNIIDKIVPVSSTQVAEMAKILENIHRAVNIGLINEMKIIADKMNINIYEVIDAASTKPFGFTPYYPGPGLGGHCIPIDPFYLTWKAKQHGVDTKFIKLAGKINNSMPKYVVKSAKKFLKLSKIKISHAKILILGVAYKKDINDVRESPAFEIINILMKEKARLYYHDPFVKKIPEMRKYNFNMKSVVINKVTISAYDLIIIVTNHSSVNYKMIQKYGKRIVDARGVYQGKNYNNIIQS
jgi:UDP-N-acetyl-D-glucosamine dehydrogenase